MMPDKKPKLAEDLKRIDPLDGTPRLLLPLAEDQSKKPHPDKPGKPDKE